MIGYAHTLFCDRLGCRAKVTVEGTRSADHARLKARVRHGWQCTATRDHCPAHRAAQPQRAPR
ncbi:hypothetical protein [Streptomyces sp. NPDC055058]